MKNKVLPVNGAPLDVAATRPMLSQRQIAARLGLNQSTVSRALRGDPSIPDEMRQMIIERARSMGYQPNVYLSSLMSHIRANRPVPDRGCIALMFDAVSKEQALSLQTYREQYDGMVARATELGFHTECFWMRANGINPRRLEQIVAARGIQGMVFFPPCEQAHRYVSEMDWSRCGCATIGYTWMHPVMDRVRADYHLDVDTVMSELLRRGYRRIGMILSPRKVDLSVSSVDSCREERFRLWQQRFPQKRQIPLFSGEPGMVSISEFKRWFNKWNPEVLLSVLGKEAAWLEQMGVKVPEDVGLVCLNRPLESRFSGMEENHRLIGASVVELVSNRIIHNELGAPKYPRMILIPGLWVDGTTLRAASRQ